MDIIRSITQWISRHRVVTILSTLALIIVFMFAKLVYERSQGTLTAPLKKGEIVDAIYGIGTVTATRSFAVKPGTTANLTDIYVKEGDSVPKGGKLALIDSVTYRSPFSGVVNFLPFKLGENIFATIPALVVTDLNDRYIVVTLEQQGALRVRAGQKAKLSFDTIRNQSYDGVVKSVYSYNNNFLARIDVTSLPPEILPDMTADIAIIVQEVKDALILPVVAFDNGFVWLKRGHLLPTKTPVTLGVIDGNMAQVTSNNLMVGDTLMVLKKVAP